MTKNSLPFNYYIENNRKIMKELNDKLRYLEFQRFICSDNDLSEIDAEIYNIQRTIKFNTALL